jgi:hypothetical protein
MVYVLVDYPRLRELRQKLQEKIDNNFNNLLTMLGEKGKEVVNAILDFIEALGRFYSQVPIRVQIEDQSQSK